MINKSSRRLPSAFHTGAAVNMPDRQPGQQLHTATRPVEYYTDEQWDKCIDLTLRRATYSSLAAGAVALVLLSECNQSLQPVSAAC